MSNLNIGKFHYFGFDESPIGGNSSGLILAYAHTLDRKLVEKGNNYHKAKDYLEFSRRGLGIISPTLEMMHSRGLDEYSWMRSNKGTKFCRQRAAHASIGRLLLQSQVRPQEMVVYIDAFFPEDHTKELLKEYLKFFDYDLPIEQIHVIPGGDREIELVNFADILAYRIAASFRKMQNGYLGEWQTALPALDPFLGDLDITARRVLTVQPKGRIILEGLLSLMVSTEK